MRSTLVACVFALTLPLAAAQDGTYVPPKGGYDTPGSFLKPLDGVGESIERTLGAPMSNMYMRQVRLKVLGLENLSRLTSLQASIDKDAQAETKKQAETPARATGLLGSLLGQANSLMGKEVERQKEVAKDDLVLRLIEAGSPADTPSAALVDMMMVPNQVTGSIFGAKINKDVRVSVSADDFKPRVLIVRYRPKGAMTPLQADMTPEFAVVASRDVEADDVKATVVYDRSRESADGSVGVYLVVTSADGKATGGKYKIRFAPQQ
jgi:hypothetical protein